MEQDLAQSRPDKPLSTWGILGLGLLSLLLYFSGVFVWVTPLPLIYLYKRAGRGRALVVAILSFAAVAALFFAVIPSAQERWGWQKTSEFFFWVPGIVPGSGEAAGFSPIFSFFYFALFSMIGVLLGEWERFPYSMTRLTAQVVGAAVAAIALLFWWRIGSQWRVFFSGMESYFVAMMDGVAASAVGGEEMKSQWGMLKPYFPQIAYYAVRLMPAMILDTLLFVVWLNIVIARRLFPKERCFPSVGLLRQWRLPFLGVWLVIACALVLAADAYGLKIEALRFVAINSLMVFALIYFFQGLAIAVYYVVRWSLSSLVRMLLYALLLLAFQPVGILLMAFGFFDSWFDFRKLAPKPAA